MAQEFEIHWFAKNFMKIANDVSFEAMQKAAAVLEREVKLSFNTGASMVDFGKSGRANKKRFSRGKGRYHRPSAPGSPPSVDYGSLRASIGTQIITQSDSIRGFVGVDDGKLAVEYKKRHRKVAVRVSSSLKYGLYLELGTKNMAPRPFLLPALAKTKNKIDAIFKRAMK